VRREGSPAPAALATVLGGRVPPSWSIQRATISAGLDAAGTQAHAIADTRPASASEKPDLMAVHVLTATGR
jgi:hypothetical protein